MKGKVVGYERHVVAQVYFTNALAKDSTINQQMFAENAVKRAFATLDLRFKNARWVLESLTNTPQDEYSNMIIAIGRRVKRGDD